MSTSSSSKSLEQSDRPRYLLAGCWSSCPESDARVLVGSPRETSLQNVVVLALYDAVGVLLANVLRLVCRRSSSLPSKERAVTCCMTIRSILRRELRVPLPIKAKNKGRVSGTVPNLGHVNRSTMALKLDKGKYQAGHFGLPLSMRRTNQNNEYISTIEVVDLLMVQQRSICICNSCADTCQC